MKILALSKVVFDRLMLEKKVTPANVEQQDRILFISINEDEDHLTDEYKPYFPEDKANVKVMHFSDVEKDQEVTKIDGSGDKILVKAMTQEQAADLYSFIKNNIKGKDAVLIHCTAGVSRSGAIASFIQDFVSGSWEMFKHDNPNILPNAHVYRLLHDEWYKDLEYLDRMNIEYINPLTNEEINAIYKDEGVSVQTMTRDEVVRRWGKKLSNQRK